MSNLLTFTIDSSDRTEYVLLDGFNITNRRNSFPTAFVKIRYLNYLPFTSTTLYPIVITDNVTSTQLFTGYLKTCDFKFYKTTHIIEASCSFINELSLLYGTTTLNTTDTEINVLEAVIGGWTPDPITTHVITGTTVTTVWNSVSQQRILNELAAMNDRYYYFDGDGELHYFANTGEAAPFALSDTPNNTTTFPFSDLIYSVDYWGDGAYNSDGGSLVCWKSGLMPGMHLDITYSNLSWSAQSFIIDEVKMKYAGGDLQTSVNWLYEVHFGTAKKRRVSDLVVRSNYTVSAVDRGLVPPLENDVTKFLRSDGTWQVP
jgi:hypothetical protein